MTLMIGVQPTHENGAVLVTDSMVQMRRSTDVRALLCATPRFERLAEHGFAIVSGIHDSEVAFDGHSDSFDAAVSCLWQQCLAAQADEPWVLTGGESIPPCSAVMAAGIRAGSVVLVHRANHSGPVDREATGGAVWVGGWAHFWGDRRELPAAPSTMTEARAMALQLAREFIDYCYRGQIEQILLDGRVPGVAPPYWLASIAPGEMWTGKVAE